jgi:hypothetical protein
MEKDRTNKVRANSVHVDANFNTLLNAVNNKIDKDGSTVPTADLPMGNHKVTGLAQPTNSGDATTKGYVDALVTELRNSIAQVKAQATTNANTIVNNLKTMFPVGSVYIGTQSTCPMASLISGSTWKLVSSGRALWTGTGSNGNSTIEAGLPNITGKLANYAIQGTGATGAFYATDTVGSSAYDSTNHNRQASNAVFDASRSSSVYGKSSTVQPPAYVVNVWRRTA